MDSEISGLENLRDASRRIDSYIHRTPVFTSAAVNQICEAEVFFKAENMQKVGAFKARGAVNAVFSLSNSEAEKGVATHSSGNHAAALAYAAGCRGIKAYVVMPENAPSVKKAAVAGYGAEITYCESTQQAREATLLSIVRKTGAQFIHPYDDYRVIAGQATAAMEMIEQVCDLDAVIAPVGGGGLLSGTALALSSLNAAVKVIGAEPQNADDAYKSMLAGRIIPVDQPLTIADGLRTSLGELTFPIIHEKVDSIITVTEEAIIGAMRLIWERVKIVVEPSAAVTLAVLLTKRSKVSGRKIGLILTGGNADLDNLPWVD
jgi:threonine dehydratase